MSKEIKIPSPKLDPSSRDVIHIYQSNPTDFAPSLSDFIVTECGFSDFGARKYHLIREQGRRAGEITDWHMIYLVKNSSTFITSRDEIRMKAGELIFIPPNTRHGYKIEETDLVAYYWIHFLGDKIEPLLRDLQLETETVYSIGLSTGITRLFDLIIEELQTKNIHYSVVSGGLLIQLLSVIAQKKSISLQAPGIKRAIAAIRSEYNSDQSVEEYARNSGYSKYHFIRLFKEATGQTPIEYRIRLRLENACSLLRSTSYSMHEIAEAIGFSDPAYFSRLFKKNIGKSPQAYRKEFESGTNFPESNSPSR